MSYEVKTIHGRITKTGYCFYTACKIICVGGLDVGVFRHPEYLPRLKIGTEIEVLVSCFEGRAVLRQVKIIKE